MGEFKTAIKFLKQRDPTHHSLSAFEKAFDLAQESLMLFQEPGTRTAWPFWRPPTSRLDDRREMTDLFRELCALSGLEMDTKITASAMQQGLRRHGLHEFTSSVSGPIEPNTFIKMACNEIERMKQRAHMEGAHTNVLQNLPQPTQTTELQSSSSGSSEGDDTQRSPHKDPPLQ